MLKISFVGVLLLTLPLITFANEVYDAEGVASSDSKAKACSLALSYARKEALDEAGIVVQAETHFNQKLVNKKSSSTFEVSIGEKSSGVVKTINIVESTQYDPSSGSIKCIVNASFVIETKKFEEKVKNKKYIGELPGWVKNPPNILGKLSIVSRSKSKEGAISSVLFEFKSRTEFDQRVNTKVLQKTIVNDLLSKNIAIRGMYKSVANSKGVIEVISAIELYFAGNKVVTLIKKRDELNPSYFEEDLKVLDGNGLDEILEELNKLGFELKVVKVTTDVANMWFALLIVRESYINPENVRLIEKKEGI